MDGQAIGLFIKLNKYKKIVKKLLNKENIKRLDDKEREQLEKDNVTL